jgi:hypothetical protein
MRILLAIDDTDNLESIGTGEVLENLGAALGERGLADCGFVTRHQLYIHESIPYTSHNSAMCFAADTGDLPAVIAFARDYMDVNCAEGSDPGLCIVNLERLGDGNALMTFGRAAKASVLTKEEAYIAADPYSHAVFLSEHGGTGGGVIGALAGCGLRLTGSDGKIKGKLMPPKSTPVITVEALCEAYTLAFCMDTGNKTVSPVDTVLFHVPSKAVYWNHRPAMYLDRDRSGRADWRVLSIQELKGVVS